MRPQKVAQTGVGSSVWLPMDRTQTPFNVGFGCIVSGTATYSVQHTFDDVLGGESPTAFDNMLITGMTSNQDGNYAFPVTAIRLNVTAGSGTVTMIVLQGN